MSLLSMLVSCVVVTGFALFDESAQERRSPARGAMSNLSWLAGSWKSEMGPVSGEERWTPSAGGAMLGVSRTLKQDKMIAFEYLRIVERDGSLVYIAQPNGQPPTEFALSSLTERSATFENPRHDFPKMIRYTLLRDGRLEARVSDGGQKGESFVFTRMRSNDASW